MDVYLLLPRPFPHHPDNRDGRCPLPNRRVRGRPRRKCEESEGTAHQNDDARDSEAHVRTADEGRTGNVRKQGAGRASEVSGNRERAADGPEDADFERMGHVIRRERHAHATRVAGRHQAADHGDP